MHESCTRQGDHHLPHDLQNDFQTEHLRVRIRREGTENTMSVDER